MTHLVCPYYTVVMKDKIKKWHLSLPKEFKEVTIEEIHDEFFRKEPLTKALEMEIANILKELDFFKKRTIIDDSKKTIWNNYTLQEIENCKKWIGLQKRLKTFYTMNSYRAKHLVERWAGIYIGNDSFIKAVQELNIPYVVEGPNIMVGISEKKTVMSYLVSQYKKDTPIGDLARDVIKEFGTNPIKLSFTRIKKSLDEHGACSGAYIALKEAKEDYRDWYFGKD